MIHRLVVGAVLCLLSVVPAASQAQTVAFIDQGVPATVLLDGGTIQLRVVDSAASWGPGRDTVAVTVSSDLGGDSESLTLLETGPSTGIFEGVIDLEPGGSPSGPGLATATSQGPPAVRDTLHATYGSASAAASLAGSRVRFVDEWGRESTTFAAGHTGGLRVRDELRNQPLSRDTLTVFLAAQGTSDSKAVTLQETAVNSGVFEGPFTTVRTSVGAGYGVVGVTVPDQLTATLADFDGLGSSSAQAQITGSIVVLRDAEGRPATSFVESSPVHVLVVAPGAAASSITVQVTSALGGDTETLTLFGTDGVTFEGEIPTVLTYGSAFPPNGVLEIVQAGGPPAQTDTVTVTYTGSDGTSSASAGFVTGRIAFLDARGRAASFYAAGGEAHVRMEYQFPYTPGVATFGIELVNLTTGEQENLRLTETGPDSGVFTGSLPLALSGSTQWFDERLNAQPGEQIEVRYRHPYDSTLDVAAQAAITSLSLEFLDERGEPTDEIVEAGQARVRMHSAVSNSSPGSTDAATIEMRVRLTGDLEALTLTETGPDTGVFEGSLPMVVATYSQSDGTLQTANSGMPDYRPDEVLARSGPVEIAARTIGARIELLDAFGRKTTSYAAGETVHLRIFDPFWTLYGDSFTLAIASLGTGDVETVTMQETGPATGIFTGSIATAASGANGPDGRLGVDLADEIEVRHVTGFSPIEITARAGIQASAVLFLDAAGQPATSYIESTRAYVRVVSTYHNFNPGSAETVQVEIRAELSADVETLVLTETGPDTGVFEGSIAARLSLSGAQPGNGTVETTELGHPVYQPPHVFDSLRATFSTPPGAPAVARIGLTGSRTWFGNAAGTEVLSYPVSGTAWVWVEDQNRNTPGQWDQVQVEVRAFPSSAVGSPSDSEYLTLQETARDSGIFRVAVPLPGAFSPSGDGKLGVQPGGQIEAVHQDFYGATASSSVADVAGSSLEFIDDAGNPTSELVEGGLARIRMLSFISNNAAMVDSVAIEIRSLRSGDLEAVTLTETGADTSLFEGSIPTMVSPGFNGDGVLQTVNSGFPDSLPDQITARYGPNQVTALMAGARVRFFDASGRETASYAAGESVRVRVVDHNRNTPQVRESVNVYLTSQNGGDTEGLTLQETGFDTAVFEGVMASGFTQNGTPSDGHLRVYPDDQVRAEYSTAYSSSFLVATAAITPGSVRFVDAAGQPAAVYLESSRAYVRVISANNNQSPGTAETVSIEIRSELSPDVENLVLTETGFDTGVFAGSIQTRLSLTGVFSGNGTLEVVESGSQFYQPPHEFDTLKATFTDPYGTREARIGLTGSRTWFADATGAEVLSYAVGDTAYVRVEDQNRNVPGQWNTVQVRLRALGSGDEEYVELLETTRESGIFVKAIALEAGASQYGDGRLSVMPGEQIEASHGDYFGETVSSAVADVAGAALEFIDEAGEPAAELLEGGTARVRMLSLAGNGNPGMVDTVSIAIETLHTGDVESLTLTETGADTSVFEGSIELQTGPAQGSNGTLETRNSDFPEYRPEEVTARYGPVSATVPVAGARVRFFDAFGRETAGYAAGESVRVRVVDHNRNTPQNRESVNVYLTSQNGGDTEGLTLQETGFDTAIFEGVLASGFTQNGTPSDGHLRVYPDDQVTAVYSTAFTPSWLRATAAITAGAVRFVDAAGQPAAVYLESSRAYVRVISANSNQSPGTAETVSIEIRSELSPDVENLILTETGFNTGVFAGSIQTHLSLTGVFSGNGTLEVVESGDPVSQPPHEFDTLKATFTDPYGTREARIGLTGSRTWFADAAGAEVLSYAVGDTAYVRVEDQNRNEPGQWNRVQVRLRALGSGDEEFVELLETTRESGIFVKALALASGALQVGDGRLSVMPGEQIEASHGDYYGATVSSAVADIAGAALEFIDEAGEPAAELLEGGTARVRMLSLAGNGNPGMVDTVSIAIETLHTGDVESLTLTETGADTSVFEGSIELQTGPAQGSNGTLETRNSDFPEYRPEEVTARYGPVSATVPVAGARMRFFDASGRETAGYAAGESVRVRVVDHNRNTPQNRESVNVYLTSQNGGDTEGLTLQETGFDTAIFEGVLASGFTQNGTPSDGHLRVYPDDQVTAEYSTAFTPSWLRATAAITAGAVRFVDAAGQPAAVYLESSRAYVRVVSANNNQSPGTAETVSIEIRSELSPDVENLILTETGFDTGVFAGSIQTRLSLTGVFSGNGTLEVVESGDPISQPPHEFDTLKATFTDPYGTREARIGLTGSRTWFANAAGAEVLSYAVGDTAYVRVEDQNRNVPGQWNRVQVRLRSLASGDEEYVELLETTRESGIFVKALALASGALQVGDGRLSVMPGERIEASHGDYYGATVSSAVADIAGVALEFIDEAGAPAAELLEGGTARVRMLSLAGNGNPGTVDTVSIAVEALHTGDVESITLTETGADTSVFEGSIELQTGPALGNNGTIETRNSDFPEYRPEEVTARYGPVSATVPVGGARVRFFDASGRETAGYAAGESVRVRVVDHNRNTPQNRESINVYLTSQNGGDTEGLTLQETGFDTAVFEGVMASGFTQNGTPSDGHLRVYPDDQVRAEYSTAFTPNWLVATASITSGAVRFVDASGQPAAVYLESSRAYVRVVSTHNNQSPGTAETVSIEIRSELSPDVENLILTETGFDTGVFAGSIQTRLSLTGTSSGNGTLEVVESGDPVSQPPHEFDTLKATFTDPYGTREARIGMTGSRTWFADATGAEVLSYAVGDTAYVRVEDQNRNEPGQWNRVQVRLRSLGSGDEEYVELLETTRNSGIFVKALALASGALQVGDGRLSVMPGEQIEASHGDYYGATVSAAVAGIAGVALEFIDDAGQPAAELLEGGTARVRMLSLAGNGNPGTVDTVSIAVEALHTGDVESITLTETGANTSVFEGSIGLQTGPAQGNNGTIETRNSDFPEYRPEEVTARYGPVSATVPVAGARMRFFDAFGRETAGYAAGESVRVRVVDHNRNTPQNRESVNVYLTSQNGGDTEGLTLQETGFDTAVFEGVMASGFTQNGTSSDGHLRVYPDDQVTAEYSTAFSPSWLLATAAITSGSVQFVDAAGRPAAVYLESSRAYLRVVSANNNQSPGTAETVSIEIRSELSPDIENLILTETGFDTGVFAGSIQTRLSLTGTFSGNGTLEVVESGDPVSQPPHELDTLKATFTDPYGTREARIGMTGSRTWFADAAGAEVLSYAVGETASVRVEDQNRNDPGQPNTVQVRLRSAAGGDEEIVELLETSPESGIFVKAFDLAGGALQVGDGRLSVMPGEQIEADHGDYYGATSSSAVADIKDLSLEFIDEAGERVSELLEGAAARVRMFRLSGNSDPGQADTVSISVEALHTGDVESLTLTETGANTSVFEGSIGLRTGPAQGNNGTLETRNSDFPEYRPEEVTARYGPIQATVPVVGARIAFLNLRGQEVTAYPLRSTVRLRVTDHNRNADPGQPETLFVSVSSLAGDTEPLTLTETGTDTGLFEGSIPTTDAGTAGADGVLLTGPGRIEAVHAPAFDPNPIRRQATILDTLAPVAADDTATTQEGTAAVIPVLANDSGTGLLTVAALTQPAQGAAAINPDGTVTYTPAPGFSGTDTFTYLIVDAQDGEDVGAVTVTVTPGNQAPAPAYDNATTPEDQPVIVSVLANDTDPDTDPLRVVAVTQPAAGGTAAINPDEATVTFTPAPDFNGQAVFQYTVRDPGGLEGTSAVTVTVTPVNDAPVANDDTASTPEDTPVTIDARANDSDIDSATYYVENVSVPAHGTAVIQPGRTILYTPAPDFTGTDSFDYTLWDDEGAIDAATVTVTVTGENDAPVANDDAASMTEDGEVSIAVLGNDTDAENDPLDVTAVTQGTHGTVVENADGTVTYTPAANFSGTDAFTYTITDGTGFGTATVTVTVFAGNDAPVAEGDAATVAEDGSVAIAVLGNDTDPEDDTLQVGSVTQGAHGTVAINPDRTVEYTPAANYNGTDTFTYTAGDGFGGSATASVSVTITPVNDAPVANGDTALVAEDGSVAVPVLANDEDADGDTPTVSAVTQGAHGAVAVNPDQTVTYTPAANYNGPDTFTYTISDGNGGTATASVAVTVGSDNDAPVATADSASTPEDTAVTVAVLANDSDPDGDALDVLSVTQGTQGTVALNADDTLTYTPALNFHGSDTFTYTVGDGHGGSATASVTVTVTPVNDPPVANADTALVAEDGTTGVAVLANDEDADGDTPAVVSVTQGAHGAVAINPDQTVSYTPAANYNGGDAFTYTISDGNGGTATAAVTVTVSPANDAPAASPDSAATAEDTPVTVTVLANDTDPENDTLDVTAVTQGASGTVAINPDETVTYTPNANFSGTDAFTYTISDGNGGTSTAAVAVTISPANDAPVAAPDAATVAEDGSVTVTVLANDSDPENDALDVTAVTQGAHGTVALNANDTITYTPAANYSGSDSFTYTVSDGNGGTATAAVAITVTPGNDAPAAGPDSATVAEDGTVAITVLANDSDPENDTLNVASVTQGAHGSVTINPNKTVTYAPAANYNGGDSFTYTIDDGNGGTATANVTMTVTPVNDAPVAVADTATVTEDTAVAITVLANDTDPENDTLNVASVTQGAHGSVTINPNKTLLYVPAANYNGGDAFTYTVNDGNGGTATATVTVTVTAVNDTPTANADTASTAEDVPVAIAVLANDTDPEGTVLNVASVTQGAHGSVSINPNKTVTYTPAANYSGGDSFTYTMNDGNGGTATATVTVTVTAVNDAPVAVNDTVSTLAETAVNIPVLTNDVDVDGPSLVVASITQPAHGTVTLISELTVRYTPASAYKGPDSFTYTVSDGAGGTATATVNVTVNAPPRIATNLQVLYGFNEGSGTTVTDTSGVGTPLNLTIGSAAAVTWISGGLQVNAATLIQSAGAATKVLTACQSTNAITLEAWVQPANLTQTASAPIVTVSQSAAKRNFTLGQTTNRWDIRLRTSTSGMGGANLTSPAGSATLNLTHVVFTRDAAGAVQIYVNGVLSSSTTLTGSFSSWANNYKLGVANQLDSGAPWLGKLYLVAIYNRSLSSTEARQNWLAGQ